MRVKIKRFEKPRYHAGHLTSGIMATVKSRADSAASAVYIDDLIVRVEDKIVNLTQTTFVPEIYRPLIQVDLLDANSKVELMP